MSKPFFAEYPRPDPSPLSGGMLIGPDGPLSFDVELAHVVNLSLRNRHEPKPAAPVWERITLRRGPSGDAVDLDGETHVLRGGYDLLFLEALKQAQGAPLQTKALPATCTRPDRIYYRLPRKIRDAIERCGRGGPGWYFRAGV